MEPVSLIVAAVVAGATAGLKEQAHSAVRDAYGALKQLITGRHKVDVTPVERRPESAAKQQSLEEDLADASAAEDAEVREAAQRVVTAVREHDAAAARAVGVDLDDVAAQLIRISNVSVRGNATGVELSRVEAQGSIVIEGIRVEEGDNRARP